MFRTMMTAAVAVLVLFASEAEAVEPLSVEELVSHCKFYAEDLDGEDGIFCVRYIQGFIDGAMVTDERVAYNVAAQYDKDETFAERAMRTRLGSQIEEFPSYYAEFCLGVPVPLEAVVELVVADMLNPAMVKGETLAREVVYTTLRREYPCEIG